MTISLNGSDLTVTQVVAVARHGEAVALAPEAVVAMRRARAVVQDVLAGGEPVYGLTTGVGERKAFLLDPAERRQFNLRLVLNHRIAQGDAAPADVVRGAMLCLANSYAKGVTGVRPELAQMIVTLLSEGLALVSSNAFTTAWACIATADADALLSVLAHPVSYELASSVKGEGIEDRATMAPLSARRLADMISLCARVAAIEFVVAAQAIDLRAPGELGLGTGRAYRMIRELVPFTQADDTFPADLEPVVDLVTRGDLTPAA